MCYATFNNISFISWRSVLFAWMKPENYRTGVRQWQTWWIYEVHLRHHEWKSNSQILLVTSRSRITDIMAKNGNETAYPIQNFSLRYWEVFRVNWGTKREYTPHNTISRGKDWLYDVSIYGMFYCYKCGRIYCIESEMLSLSGQATTTRKEVHSEGVKLCVINVVFSFTPDPVHVSYCTFTPRTTSQRS